MKHLPIEDSQKRNIIITIPSTTKWEDYQKELDLVKHGSYVMNFKVSQYPKQTDVGQKCYICYKGNIIGYMFIIGFEEKTFECHTTGKPYTGKFIQRSGEFYKIEPIPMKGFQGFRYFQ